MVGWRDLGMDAVKKIRKRKEQKRIIVRDMVIKIYLALQFDVGEDCMATWVQDTKTFPSLLRRFVDDWIKDRTEADTPWIFGMCCMLTDFAEKEKIKEELLTPKDIFIWFAEYLEELFPKPDLVWETTKILSPLAIERMIDFLDGLKEQVVEPQEKSR
jgi:hypothetical protein